MRALRTFTVRPHLPQALAPLQELALNLRWSWDERTRELFRWMDPGQWEATGHDPVAVLAAVGGPRLDELGADAGFLSFLGEVHDELRRHLEGPQWFQRREGSPLRSVAYFSPEFGLAEALPQYSGGLGVLAGDHLKAASGLGVPLTGIGLFYREGYFRQELSADGWQQERFPVLDPHAMPVTLVPGARVEVNLAGSPLTARVWQAHVGRVPLFLLDANVDENDDEGRAVTDRLYGGDLEHRIRQEILLGIGGVRALDAIGRNAQVFHSNEGHAGFLALERLRRLITAEGLRLPEALEAVRASTVFTTHTPVPAGIDLFPRSLMERYFKDWSDECGVDFDELMALGHWPGEPPDAPFNMAVMGLHVSGLANGVSRLHARVSRTMFHGLWPDLPVEEIPVTSVTNGVHAPTWTSPEMSDLLSRQLMPAWSEAVDWSAVEGATDDEVWWVRNQGRERLVEYVRSRLRSSLVSRGASPSGAAWAGEILDPSVLTIGFARRFAAYKRATLLLSQPDRLRQLLLSEERPVQIVFAGKAHPADQVGKEMIRQILDFSHDPAVRHRFVFLDDYDIASARALYQGADVWLNTPRRPFEACGTSGQKAALNGALNCSILDGWWDEMFDGDNGWAIPSDEMEPDLGRRDGFEAENVFRILEGHVVPLFYDRPDGGIPRRWVARVKASLRSLGPRVVASRMVRDYLEQLYEPAARRSDALAAAGFGRARALAEWKARVAAAWDEVRIVSVGGNGLDDGLDGVPRAGSELGGEREVTAVVCLGSLAPADVAVEMAHGPVGPDNELVTPALVPMDAVGAGETPGEHHYRGRFRCERAGRYGFTVRVVPAHSDLATFAELGRVAWA